jgi:hypothetical protein
MPHPRKGDRASCSTSPEGANVRTTILQRVRDGWGWEHLAVLLLSAVIVSPLLFKGHIAIAALALCWIIPALFIADRFFFVLKQKQRLKQLGWPEMDLLGDDRDILRKPFLWFSRADWARVPPFEEVELLPWHAHTLDTEPPQFETSDPRATLWSTLNLLSWQRKMHGEHRS